MADVTQPPELARLRLELSTTVAVRLRREASRRRYRRPQLAPGRDAPARLRRRLGV
jgi:hypothetical protein